MNKLIRKAFTLIELLVVIAIIGILSGLIVVSMSGVTDKANIAKAQVFSNSLRNSLMLNLISEWKLDEIIGTASPYTTPDSWSGGNTGTLYGTGGTQVFPQLQNSNCVSNKCFLFDGTDDYVDFGNAINLKSPQGTMNYWLYLTDLTTGRGVIHIYEIGGSDYLRNYINPNGQIDLVIEDENVSCVNVVSNALPLNKWTNITWVQDGISIKLYINGQLSILAGTNSGVWWTNHLSILTTRLGLSWTYFKGSIDEIRMYNAAMQTSQIKEQYYAGLNSLLANGSISARDYLLRLNETAQN
ncbi:prepilin-type N-terminal cleavage/methylation domain-containing protein [bacterium]|jgi:prepilin-type N-terminal cleavage/methylation domain-containing protein|nr:prepilin-type N-terminal cleavage/methylation domain-containing protein [bacterium]